MPFFFVYPLTQVHPTPGTLILGTLGTGTYGVSTTTGGGATTGGGGTGGGVDELVVSVGGIPVQFGEKSGKSTQSC